MPGTGLTSIALMLNNFKTISTTRTNLTNLTSNNLINLVNNYNNLNKENLTICSEFDWVKEGNSGNLVSSIEEFRMNYLQNSDNNEPHFIICADCLFNYAYIEPLCLILLKVIIFQALF